MIQLSSLLPAIPHGPVRPAALDPAGASSFALAMGALVPPRAALPQPDGEADPLLPGRQPLAEAGKDLPEGVVEGDAEADADPEDPDLAEDVAFAWFAAPLPPEVAPSVPVELREPDAPTPVAAATAPAPPVSAATDTLSPLPERVKPSAGPALPTMETAPVDPRQSVLAANAPAPGGAPVETAPFEVTAATLPAGRVAPEAPRMRVAAPPTRAMPLAEETPPVAHASMPLRDALAPVQRMPQQAPAARPAQFQPVTATVAPPIATPARAAAIEAAVLSGAPAVSAPSRRAPAIEPAVIALAPSADAMRPHAVAAAADVQQGAIDMRRQEWTGQVIEQIEALRDAAPLRETRLSLAPEALGKVDISIRQEGEHVHVHFATETPAARQLIADAQPRLSELAEARGLKLGQTSFESGTAGQGGRDAREQFAQPQSPKPRPASSPSDVGTPDDDRIA